MEISVLGAARQVGRSAFLVKGKSTNILLDYGVLTMREPVFPMHVQPKDVDGIVLSHAHLDHSGAAPMFFLAGGPGFHSTSLSAELTELLITDFVKISGFYLPFEYIDLMSMMKKVQPVAYDQETKIGEFTISFKEAGHLPGGASIIVDDGRKRLVYTGDINSTETQLQRPADTDYGELDLLLTESTYALADHPPREQVEEEFVEFANDVVERGGTLLVPAFSVGRAQEVAMVLRTHGFSHSVAMDGMALKTNEILLRYQEFLKNPDLFKKTLEDTESVVGWSQRRKVAKTPGVIIAPAGMLVGGASIFYNKEVAMGTRNAVSLVSFQVPGSPGRTLLDKGLAVVDGRPRKVQAEIKRFDFSSHSGRSQLLEMLGRLKGQPKVMTIHGESEGCTRLAQEIREKFGLEAVAPEAGDHIQI